MDESKFDNFLIKGNVTHGMQVDYNDVSSESIHLVKKLDIKPLLKATEGQHLKYLNYGLIPGGVPQGMPMSPFLSILAVKDYLAQVTSVNYADDQTFYSKTDFVVKDDPNLGIIHSSEKCS